MLVVMLQHSLTKLCPHDMLNFGVLRLYVTNCNGHHFTITRIVHMISHSCPTNNMLHMITHDHNVLQIPYRLHSHDEPCSIPHVIYRHLENENFFSYNMTWEVAPLDVITTLGL